VKTLIEPVSIFEEGAFEEEIEGIEGDAAKADAIAARVKKVITERMEEDPTLYKKLSELIQEAIDAHRAKRLSDIEYFRRVQEHLRTARSKGATGVPASLQQREEARAYYGVLKEKLTEHLGDDEALAELATSIEDIITCHKVRDWQHNSDVQNRMLNAIDDVFHNLKQDQGVFIPYADLDEVMGKIMNIARVRDSQ
jgi:type I restriction enzyme, R subunit